MFNTLPPSKTLQSPLLPNVNPLLNGLGTSGATPQGANEFTRAMDRAQDTRRAANPLAAPATPASRPQSAKPAAAPARQTQPTPTPGTATYARPAAPASANRSANAAARETTRTPAGDREPRIGAKVATEKTPISRRTTATAAAADEAPSHAATPSAASVSAAPAPAATAPAPVNPAPGAGSAAVTDTTANSATDPNAKVIDGSATSGATGSGRPLHTRPGIDRTGANHGVGTAGALGFGFGVGIGVGLGISGLTGHATRSGAAASGAAEVVGAGLGPGVSKGTSEGVPNNNLNTNAQTQPLAGATANGQTLPTDSAASAAAATTDPGQVVGAERGFRITGPVCEYRMAPHLMDDPIGAAVEPGAVGMPDPAAATATTGSVGLTGTGTDMATSTATNAGVPIPADGWRQPAGRGTTVPLTTFEKATALTANPLADRVQMALQDVRNRQALSDKGVAGIAPPPAPLDEEHEDLGEGALTVSGTGNAGPTLAVVNTAAPLNDASRAALAVTAKDWLRTRSDNAAEAAGSSRVGTNSIGNNASNEASATNPAAMATPAPGAQSFAATWATQFAANGPSSENLLTARPGTPEFAAQASQRITLMVLEGVQTAKLQLHPAELGPVTVQIQLDGAAAHVHLAVEHAQTRQALEESLPQLANQLREAGLTLSGGGVFEQPRSTPQDQQQQQPSQQAPQRSAGTDERSTAPGGSASRSEPRRAAVARGLVDLVA